MNLRGRHLLVVLVITLGVYADRAITSTPRFAPRVAQLAKSLAGRLSLGLPPSARISHLRRGDLVCRISPGLPIVARVAIAGVHVHQGHPFCFRLPPPLLA